MFFLFFYAYMYTAYKKPCTQKTHIFVLLPAPFSHKKNRQVGNLSID